MLTGYIIKKLKQLYFYYHLL